MIIWIPMKCNCGCGKEVKINRRYAFIDKRDGRQYFKKYSSKGYCIGHNNHKGKFNGMFGRKRTEKEKALISKNTKLKMAEKRYLFIDRMRASIIKTLTSKKMVTSRTSIEIKVKELLDKNHIFYEEQKSLFHRTVVDFLLKDKCTFLARL